MTTRQEAVEDVSMFDIKEPQTYLVNIIPLAEMIWANADAQKSELAIIGEYLHVRVQKINEMTGYSDIFWGEPGSMVALPHPSSPRSAWAKSCLAGRRQGDRVREAY